MSGPGPAESAGPDRFASIGVVGAGLIGGSIALRLHALGYDVVVADPDPATRAAAGAAGLTVGEAADCDLVVLATPLDALPEAMGRAARGPARMVVDVGSVKGAPAAAAADVGLGERHLGLHPMSGTEADGFAAADPDLLVGVTWAVVRPAVAGWEATPAAAAVVAWLLEAFDATIVVLDAAEHDRAVALISHLPHVVANALLGLAGSAPTHGGDLVAARLAAGSFRDGTRVAGRNARRTANMLGDNAGAVVAALDALLTSLAGYRADLVSAADPTGDPGLRTRLEEVVALADGVRSPAEPEWRDGADLAAVLDGSAPGARGAVTMRPSPSSGATRPAGAADWVWAPLDDPVS